MGRKDYETPPDYFARRWARHRFNVDAAASDANALVRPVSADCPRCGAFCMQPLPEGHAEGRYYTAETNGLDPSHYRRGDHVWCNPPYDASIIRWVRMFRQLQMEAGVMSELLLPASTDTRWFHGLLWNDEAGHWRDNVRAHFIGRVNFLLDGQPIRGKDGRVQETRQSNLLVTLKARVK